MPLFGSSKKSPVEMVKNIQESLQVLEKESSGGKKSDKALEDITKQLGAMKTVLYGSGDQGPQTEQVAQLAQEMYNHDLFIHLLRQLHRLDFECKKDVAQIFNNILRRQIGTRYPTVEYICKKEEMLFMLVDGYETHEVALNCGIMLREIIRHEPLAKIILNDDKFYMFFEYVEMSTFDIASDAFTTFKELLTRHKITCAEFLEKGYDKFFGQYSKLLHSENYVTKRQSLKLLGELLLDRHNFTVMTRYISNPENLKLMMNMLKDKSRNIQFEAFHVFKVFVANPNKTPSIQDILVKNKDKLVEFLTNFHTDRTEDEQFNDEKVYLIKQIKEL
ncbi:Calcium-binding protein 39-like [Desmophyllum pertusum]|uniref:Calcium-binding protein 39-like n=1 Tax=Desmophyllum pertusum TaxID=174260 RepID=A0A9W9ZAA6_9CNID|nr:Calcium-binding protein 39-like [Desmophyllum pertusum]